MWARVLPRPWKTRSPGRAHDPSRGAGCLHRPRPAWVGPSAGCILQPRMSPTGPGAAGPLAGREFVAPSRPSLWLTSWRRVLLSLAVAAMGLIDLLSALLSHPPERLRALMHIVPTTVLDTSRTYTLLTGA